MKKQKLNNSGVVFNADEHTYTLDGKQLSGITSLLHRVIFPDMYSGVPEATLANAASRGTLIHKTIEDFHSSGLDLGDTELEQYQTLLGDRVNDWIANEYLVTDNEKYASAIDLVYTHGNNISLADIKTVSKMDNQYVEYCSWQLSIYSRFFETQNPGLKVDELFVIWLPKEIYGKPKLVKIERKSDEELDRLFEADAKGEVLTTRVAVSELNVPEQMQNDALALFMAISDMTKRFNDIKAALLKMMQENNIEETTIGNLKLKRKRSYTRESIDTSKLKKDLPDIAEKYKKLTTVSESLNITNT